MPLQTISVRQEPMHERLFRVTSLCMTVLRLCACTWKDSDARRLYPFLDLFRLSKVISHSIPNEEMSTPLTADINISHLAHQGLCYSVDTIQDICGKEQPVLKDVVKVADHVYSVKGTHVADFGAENADTVFLSLHLQNSPLNCIPLCPRILAAVSQLFGTDP